MSLPHVGPRQLRILDLLAARGPKTPRQVAAELFPDLKGRGEDGGARVRGAGKGVTSAAGKANRGVGGVLGRMVRAGWVKEEGGARFHVLYSVTAAGLAAAKKTRHTIESDPILGAGDTVPEGRRRCTKCSRARLLDAFDCDRGALGGLSRRCRFCHTEQQGEYRAAKLLIRDADLGWTRASLETQHARTLALLKATRQARRVGTWRGRDGLRAYVALGEALAAFGSDWDPTLSHAEAVDPHDRTPPHHADPADAEWDKRRHTTPPRYRERFFDPPRSKPRPRADLLDT